MRKTALGTGYAVGLLLTVSSLVMAQERPVPVRPVPTRPGTVVRAPRSILGARVSIQGGTSVGTVEDVVINPTFRL